MPCLQDPELLEQMLTMSGRPEGVAALRLAAAVRLNAEALRPPGGAKDSKEAVRDANRLLDKAAELYGQVSCFGPRVLFGLVLGFGSPGGAKGSKETVRDAYRLLDKAAELYRQVQPAQRRARAFEGSAN